MVCGDNLQELLLQLYLMQEVTTGSNGNTILSTITLEQQLPFIKGLSVKGTVSYDNNAISEGMAHTLYYWAQDTQYNSLYL